MHCIILAADFAPRPHPFAKNFPNALLPIKGKALLDYLIEDVIKQKEISHITVITNAPSFPLFHKHVHNAYPETAITVLNNEIADEANTLTIDEDILVLTSDTYSSLKLQDFIRFYRQFKSLTTAASFSTPIPFYIIPQSRLSLVDSYLKENGPAALGKLFAWAILKNEPVYTYNIGSGFAHDIRTQQGYDKAISSGK